MSLSPLVQRSVVAMAFTLFCGGSFTSATYYWVINSDFVARVNGEVIGHSEFELTFERNKLLYARQGLDLNNPQSQQILTLLKENTLNNLIDQRLINQAALKEGIFVSNQELETEYQKLLTTNYQDDKAAFKRDLAANRMSLNDYRQQIRGKLLQDKFRLHLTSKLTISPTELKNYYQNHLKEFETPENIQAHHILIKTEENKPESEMQAQKKAEELYKRIQAGEKFELLAKNFSEDQTTRETGGDLGSFKRGDMVESFENAAWELKPNEISKPIKTNYGYHIIKRGQTISAKTQDFESAKKQIQTKLLEEKQSTFFKRWLETERQQADIQRKNQQVNISPPSEIPSSPSP